MSWHFEMNRRRKERLAKQLPAVARPSEGPAELQLGVSSLNSAGAASAVPAVFLPEARQSPLREDFVMLLRDGFSDEEIARLYKKSPSWAHYWRSVRFNLASAHPQYKVQFTAGEETAWQSIATSSSLTSLHAIHGNYQDITEAEIATLRRRPRVKRKARSVTAAFFGDPSPDRPRA